MTKKRAVIVLLLFFIGNLLGHLIIKLIELIWNT